MAAKGQLRTVVNGGYGVINLKALAYGLSAVWTVAWKPQANRLNGAALAV